MNLLLIALVTVTVVVFECRTQIKRCINDFLNLRDLSRIRYNNELLITYNALTLGVKTMIRKLRIYVFSNIVRTGPHTYNVMYHFAGSTYIIPITIRAGPKRVTRVTGDEDVDMTDIVVSYLGPGEDFHQLPKTPLDFGMTRMNFHIRDGVTRTFTGEQQICVR